MRRHGGRRTKTMHTRAFSFNYLERDFRRASREDRPQMALPLSCARTAYYAQYSRLAPKSGSRPALTSSVHFSNLLNLLDQNLAHSLKYSSTAFE